MNKASLIITALLMLTMVIYMAPNVIAMNQGKALRNIALWLAIFLGLALIYRTVGPGSPHPLFNLPQAMMGMSREPPAESATPDKTPDNQGFTPPKE